MKFICTQDCRDQGTREKADRFGVPIRFNYRRDRSYDIDENQLKRLTSLGFFPELFDYGDDAARQWVEMHNDELCDIVDNRSFPPTPKGTVSLAKPMLVRKGRTVGEALSHTPQEPAAAPEGQGIQLHRPAPREIHSPGKGRTIPGNVRQKRNYTPEQRKQMAERLRQGRDKKKAMAAAKEPAAAGA